MESNYPKYFYLLFFLIGSWLLTCLLHFRQPLPPLGKRHGSFPPILVQGELLFFSEETGGGDPLIDILKLIKKLQKLQEINYC
jgi:hypothetical protein